MACCTPDERSMPLIDTNIKNITIPGQFWVLCCHVGLDCGTNLCYVQFLQGRYALYTAQLSRSGSWKSDLFRTLGYWSGQVSTRWILVQTCPLWSYPINAQARVNQTKSHGSMFSRFANLSISNTDLTAEGNKIVFNHYTFGQALALNLQICGSFRALSLAQHVLECTSIIQWAHRWSTELSDREIRSLD